MYFDEDGDLAHEFYEEVLPRYKNFILILLSLLLTTWCIINLLSGGKVAREKCAELRRISGNAFDNVFNMQCMDVL